MTTPAYQDATAAPRRPCITCGKVGSLQPRTQSITRKRRHKFGFLWLLITLVTCGVGFLLWLVMPRYKETIGVDRYVVCMACGARQV